MNKLLIIYLLFLLFPIFVTGQNPIVKNSRNTTFGHAAERYYITLEGKIIKGGKSSR